MIETFQNWLWVITRYGDDLKWRDKALIGLFATAETFQDWTEVSHFRLWPWHITQVLEKMTSLATTETEWQTIFQVAQVHHEEKFITLAQMHLTS